MKRELIASSRAIAALAAVFLAWVARAELPEGEYVLEVPASSGLTAPGGDAGDCSIRGDIERCISLSLETSPTGAVTGTGTLTLEQLDGDFTGEMALDVTGQVGGSIASPKVALRYELLGEIVEPDPDDPKLPPRVLDVEGDGRFACKLDPLDDALLRCKGSARFCASVDDDRIGCDRIPFVVPVEYERVGFDVLLDLATAEDGELEGDASVEIDGAPVFAYVASGRYRAASDASKLELRSVEPDVKTKFALKKLELEQGGAAGGKMRFKLSGQRGSLVLASPAPATLAPPSAPSDDPY